MSPKEKAIELVNKYFDATDRWVSSAEDIKFRVRCALIAVDEILNMPKIASLRHNDVYMELEYWMEVKQEIERL